MEAEIYLDSLESMNTCLFLTGQEGEEKSQLGSGESGGRRATDVRHTPAIERLCLCR